MHRPGGSDDGGVEASVAGDGHGQWDEPPCPAEHLVCKRLWGWRRNKMLIGKLLTRLTSKLIIRRGPVRQHHWAFPSALLAQLSHAALTCQYQLGCTNKQPPEQS